jgi:hypothetical protein
LSKTTIISGTAGCAASKSRNKAIIAALVISSSCRWINAHVAAFKAPLTLIRTRPWLAFNSRVSPRNIQPQAAWAS